MADQDEEFVKAFEGFGDDDAPATPPVDPPKEDPAKEEPKADEPKKEEPPKEDTPSEDTPPAAEDKKEEEAPKSPETPETPRAPEAPQPLTKDDLTTIIHNIRSEERTSGQELETTTQEVMDVYYPDGLSNVLVDQASGKELKSPQDVVEASGNTMSVDEAAQWLMNEQYKLDKQVAEIKDNAKKIAETTVKFKQDGIAVLQKYEPLFKAYPTVQKEAWELYKDLVKEDKGVILSAPDMQKFYNTFLQPYRMAFELGEQKPATQAPPAAPEPPKPGAEDRMDISGDATPTPPNDPNDFAQQVSKELAKGI